MEIWINPQCSKCRSALSILDAEGAGYTVRRYLDDHPVLIQRPIITADDGTAVVARTEEAVRAGLGPARPRRPSAQ